MAVAYYKQKVNCIMKKSKQRIITVLCAAAVFVCGVLAGALFIPRTSESKLQQSLHISNPDNEYLVGSAVCQLSAESDALILQAFSCIKNNVHMLLEKCEDETQPQWQLYKNSLGENEMYHNGKRIAIIADIDDTLVTGVNYTADILGNNGDWNNAAFARYLMSDACTALPGAVDCMNYCKENGIDVYYISNRYDQGYKVGQKDSAGSYEQYQKKHGNGDYVSNDGTLIGTSLYQLYGKSIYDISMESMRNLGFPIDEQHLIINDSKLNGTSKEEARQAVINGCKDYSCGQWKSKDSTDKMFTFSCEPHEVIMLLGDQMTDFTDAFDSGSPSPIDRKQLVSALTGKFGSEWILFPNAVYGNAMQSGLIYGPEKLFQEFSYTNPQVK